MKAPMSMLDPAGPQAARIEDLWWLLFWVCTAVFVLVMAVLLAAVRQGSRRMQPPEGPMVTVPGQERRMTRAVAGAVAVTVAVLFVLLVASVTAGRAIASLPEGGPPPLTVEVTGHQWWWRFLYEDPDPSQQAVTANELHLPVGRPVIVRAKSNDVIHSFWIPSLHGKRDLIPGKTSSYWLRADRPGVFRGQCAEFCGVQHARMAFTVVVEPPERFAAWIEAQRRPAPPPATPLEQRGQLLFRSLPCPLCHTVRGTDARGSTGPDLTHAASRRTLAAGTLPNTRGHLGGWILDPQTVKPGNHMPATSLGSEDLLALLAYLESLR